MARKLLILASREPIPDRLLESIFPALENLGCRAFFMSDNVVYQGLTLCLPTALTSCIVQPEFRRRPLMVFVVVPGPIE